jgi:hypothetical protein
MEIGRKSWPVASSFGCLVASLIVLYRAEYGGSFWFRSVWFGFSCRGLVWLVFGARVSRYVRTYVGSQSMSE